MNMGSNQGEPVTTLSLCIPSIFVVTTFYFTNCEHCRTFFDPYGPEGCHWIYSYILNFFNSADFLRSLRRIIGSTISFYYQRLLNYHILSKSLQTSIRLY